MVEDNVSSAEKALHVHITTYCAPHSFECSMPQVEGKGCGGFENVAMLVVVLLHLLVQRARSSRRRLKPKHCVYCELCAACDV